MKWARTFTLGDLPFCLPFPSGLVKEVPRGIVFPAGDDEVLVGVELEDSEAAEGNPERAPLVVALP